MSTTVSRRGSATPAGKRFSVRAKRVRRGARYIAAGSSAMARSLNDARTAWSKKRRSSTSILPRPLKLLHSIIADRVRGAVDRFARITGRGRRASSNDSLADRRRRGPAGGTSGLHRPCRVGADQAAGDTSRGRDEGRLRAGNGAADEAGPAGAKASDARAAAQF